MRVNRLSRCNYIRRSLRLENTQGSLKSGKPGTNSETQGRSVMVWAALSWYSASPIIALHGQITAREYVDRLGKHIAFLDPDIIS
jgi:hypothetical protein